MDYFKARVSSEDLKNTNKQWNDLNLNSIWSIGSVSKLIEDKAFKTKEDWEKYYYESGKMRLEEIKKLPMKDRIVLQDPLASDKMFSLPKEIRDLNINYGRTKEELNSRAFLLCGYMIRDGYDLRLEAAVEVVKHRVIKDSWNGIIQREVNTIKKLQEIFPNATFKRVHPNKDAIFAVDYEIFDGIYKKAGIQIKPVSYKSSKSYIKDSMVLNVKKNEKYKQKYGLDVVYIYSTIQGNIKDPKGIEDLINIMSNEENNKIVISKI